MERMISAVIVLATVGGYAAYAGGDQKATELLAQARAAVGGDKQIAKVKGLSLNGVVQRSIGDRQVSGEITIDLQLPDKMVRSDSISPMGDAAIVVTDQGISGDTLIRNTRVLNAPPGAVIRTPPPPAPGSDAEMRGIRNSRAELARLVVSFLLSSPESLPLEFGYAGEAESPDGKADVVDVKGTNSFAAKLFLDKTSHRPLMLAYRGVSPRMVIQAQRGGPPPQSASGSPRGEPVPPPPATDLVDITMFFENYKSVDGVMLPHHITRSVDGQTSEEWTFKTVKVNPTFKPETFTKK